MKLEFFPIAAYETWACGCQWLEYELCDVGTQHGPHRSRGRQCQAYLDDGEFSLSRYETMGSVCGKCLEKGEEEGGKKMEEERKEKKEEEREKEKVGWRERKARR